MAKLESMSIFALISLTAAYTCIHPRRIPPLPRDCHTLIDALGILSINPPYNAPLLWSRSVNDNLTSLRLPKSYRLVTYIPNTCAIHIDVVPTNLDAEDTFALSSVGNIAEIIVEQCLVKQRKLGWGFAGARENIQVSVVRSDGLWSRWGLRRLRMVGVELLEWSEAMRPPNNNTDTEK